MQYLLETSVHFGDVCDVEWLYQQNIEILNRALTRLRRKEHEGAERETGAGASLLIPEHVPPAGLGIIGRVVAGAPILTVKHLARDPELHPLGEVRSRPYFLRFKGASRVNPQIHGGDDGIVRAQPWVAHGDVGEVGIDEEVTVKMSLHWRTDLWLTAEAQQQGPPLLRLRSQARVYIVS